MRRHLPYSRTALWIPDQPAVPARPAHTGWIAALPSAEELPERQPLRVLASGRRDDFRDDFRDDWRATSWTGGFVDDLPDGRPVYPAPPPRVKAGDPFLRLRRRLTRPAWPFVFLAAAQAVTILVDFLAAGWSLPAVLDVAVRLAYTSAVTLLPVAVLVWRRDASRSAPLVLAGAIVWTTLPAAIGLAWWVVRHSPGLTDRFGVGFSILVAAVTVAAYAGPAIVARGLDRVRGGTNPLASATVIKIALALVPWTMYEWFTPASAGSAATGLLDPIHLAGTVSGAALPISILCLLMLTWTCVAAVADDARPRQFWQGAAYGSAILLSVAVVELTTVSLGGSSAVSGLAARNWDGAPGALLPLAGGALIALAFACPVWSASPDTASWRGMPDDVFAWGAAGDTGGAAAAGDAGGAAAAPAGAIVTVAAGADHALAVDETGRVIAWGGDDSRQTDVPAGLSDVVAVAAGDGFSLALRGDGTVVAWGADAAGQTEVPPGLSDVTAIAAGDSFALALTAGGTVAGWGGQGEAAPPADLANVVAIAAGARHCLALRGDGRVVAWGDNGSGQTEVPRLLSGVVQVAAGRGFSLALCVDGTIAGWGDNSYGQLDVPPGLRGIVAISAGAYHALALTDRGDVVGWGGGGRVFGEAAHPWRLLDFKAVAAGNGFSLAVRAA